MKILMKAVTALIVSKELNAQTTLEYDLYSPNSETTVKAFNGNASLFLSRTDRSIIKRIKRVFAFIESVDIDNVVLKTHENIIVNAPERTLTRFEKCARPERDRA